MSMPAFAFKKSLKIPKE